MKRRRISRCGLRRYCFVVKEGMGLARPTPLNALIDGQYFFPTKMVTVPQKISRTTLKWEKCCSTHLIIMSQLAARVIFKHSHKGCQK